MMSYTVDEAKSWYEEHKDEIIEHSKCKELMICSEKIEQTCVMGVWLAEKLSKMGADEIVVDDACFTLGQRSLFGDPFKEAVKYANEYEENGSLLDKPGLELANKILDELKL